MLHRPSWGPGWSLATDETNEATMSLYPVPRLLLAPFMQQSDNIKEQRSSRGVLEDVEIAIRESYWDANPRG